MKHKLFLLFLLPLVIGAATTNVPAGGDLQAALTAAAPGDTIALAAGATFTGNYKLPAKTNPNALETTITTALSAPLGPSRLTPATAASLQLAKILSPNTAPAISVADGVQHWLIFGVEVSVVPGQAATNYGVIDLGSPTQTDLTKYATDVTVDRCYIHGDPKTGGKRGVAMNGLGINVMNSTISDFSTSSSGDTQALAVWNGPGPFKIINNDLEGGQGVIFGGAAPKVQNVTPTDITIARNLFTRPMAWKGVWQVKNQLEFKNAQNATVTGNIFENNWTSAQNGYIILFTVRTCEAGDYSWSVVKNISFTDNVIRNSEQGINILGTDNARGGCPNTTPVAGLTSNITIRNNSWALTVGNFLQLLSGSQNITIDHNTISQTNNPISLDGTPSSGFVYTNNISNFGYYGVVGNATTAGITSLAKFTPGYTFSKNVLIAPVAGRFTGFYPTDTAGPANAAAAGLNLDFTLAATSPYIHGGTDGLNIGADMGAIQAATANTVSGAVVTQQCTPFVIPGKNAMAGHFCIDQP